MKTIYKYPVPVDGEFTLALPKAAEVLCVKTQRGVPCMWAVVDGDEKAEERRTFRLIGTGHPIPDIVDLGNYVGTFILEELNFVGHLFEKKGGVK